MSLFQWLRARLPGQEVYHLPSVPPDQDNDDDLQVNMSRINENEISLSIKQACGLSDEKSQEVSMTSMIQSRELGANFSPGQKCKITSNFLPNKMKRITKYNGRPFCGTFSEDGRIFLTACQDKYLRLYETSRGGLSEHSSYTAVPAKDLGWSFLDTAYSPDGQFIVYSSWSEYLYLCPISTNEWKELALSSEIRRFCIFSLDFSHDGKEIIGGANDGCLYSYDLEYNQRELRCFSHNGDVNTVSFADDSSQILYSAGDDGLCKVWDRRTLGTFFSKPVGVFAGHMNGITFIDSKKDGRYLITNSKDQTIKLWDTRKFSDFHGEDNTRESVGKHIWDYRWQKVPMVFRKKTQLEGDTSVMTYRGHLVLQTLIRCRFSPAATTGQRYIYTGCGSGKVIIYDVLTGKIVKKLDGHKQCVRDVHWHPYLQQIISTSWDNVIGSWCYSDDIENDQINDD